MASLGNQHCANCIGTLSFPIPVCTIITPPPIGKRSIIMTVCVSLSVCLSFREYIAGTTSSIFTSLLGLCMLPMSAVRGTPLAVLRYVIYFRLYN